MPLNPDQIRLVKVRLSFPDLFVPKALEKDKDPKYGAVFLLNKSEDAGQIKALRGMIWSLVLNAFGGAGDHEARVAKATALLEKKTVRICLHEGSEKDYEGYGDDVLFISTSSNKRPAVVDRDRTPLTKDDQKPYAGCYVNAVVRLWVQDNQYGKRVNAQLQGVQFVADGEAFGAAPFDPEAAFEALDEKTTPVDGAPAGGKPDDDEIPF